MAKSARRCSRRPEIVIGPRLPMERHPRARRVPPAWPERDFAIASRFPTEKNFAQLPSRIPTSLFLVFLLALASCGPQTATGSTSSAQSSAPLSPLDAKINDYEKTAKNLVRIGRKHAAGDFSVTMLLIDLKDKTRAQAAELQKEAPKMTPCQARRLADISATTATYLKK